MASLSSESTQKGAARLLGPPAPTPTQKVRRKIGQGGSFFAILVEILGAIA